MQLLNSEDHKKLIMKLGRDPSEFRADIVHQSLLALLDSPLNKAGRLRILIRTQKGVMIRVAHDIRLPRTWKRSSGLMAQLLTSLKIKSPEGKTLLEVVSGTVDQHLPANHVVIGTTSHQGYKGQLVPDLEEYV